MAMLQDIVRTIGAMKDCRTLKVQMWGIKEILQTDTKQTATIADIQTLPDIEGIQVYTAIGYIAEHL